MHPYISPLLFYPHYVVSFVYFWLLLVYLNLVSLSDACNKPLLFYITNNFLYFILPMVFLNILFCTSLVPITTF
jgi:hypothetical protein